MYFRISLCYFYYLKFLGDIILLFLLFPSLFKVDCYFVCFVILNSELLFGRLHLKASCMAWTEVLFFLSLLLQGIHWHLSVECRGLCSLNTKLIWGPYLWLQFLWGGFFYILHLGLHSLLPCFLIVLRCR